VERSTIPGVEPDRFEDVAFRMLEQPEPPRRRPRLRRWMLGGVAAAMAAGALAAGASALTSGDPAPTPAPKGDGSVPQSPDYRGFRDCDRKHHGKRDAESRL
jgi:hypothetical protein